MYANDLNLVLALAYTSSQQLPITATLRDLGLSSGLLGHSKTWAHECSLWGPHWGQSLECSEVKACLEWLRRQVGNGIRICEQVFKSICCDRSQAKQGRAKELWGFAFCLAYGKDVNKCIYIQMTVIWLAGIWLCRREDNHRKRLER